LPIKEKTMQYDNDWITRALQTARKNYAAGMPRDAAARKLGATITLRMAEPWREYCDYRPDDLPRKGGSPVALAKFEELQASAGDDGCI
jgi:hypothetical protein